jgi:uncharacterized protein (DUF1697 family)
MTTIISMLRGVNVGGHNQIKMDALRSLYESLGLKNPQTYVQSGNVVFKMKEKNLAGLAARIEDAIEQKFGFRPGVVLRTAPELKDVIGRNPFAKRRDINPGKLLVVFFNEEPGQDDCGLLQRVKAEGEEMRADGREFYLYFPNGAGRSKLFAAIGRLKESGTSRNWNTVTKLLEMTEKVETAGF